MKTARLYYDDSRLLEFEACVIEVREMGDGGKAVVLDRTAFYPTGGGQPSDVGTLDDARVIECIDEEDLVLHVVQGGDLLPGQQVVGRVDRARRLEHMQQHTAQHILSQSLWRLFSAETRGFRIMDRFSEIDVALDQPTNERIAQAVELANEIVWQDRPIKIGYVSSDEVSRLALRREPTRSGTLRIVEIEGFDATPCGGTHARRTGEVGIILVRSWERAKRMTRVRFVAGVRALRDYEILNRAAERVALMLSSEREMIAHRLERWIEEQRELAKRVRELEEQRAKWEAHSLCERASARADGARIVAHLLRDEDAEALKRLALAAASRPLTVALLAVHEGESVRLAFARSADLSEDMGALMRRACAQIGGRGGGRTEFAQGGGKCTAEEAQNLLESLARELIAQRPNC
ncbi:MAG: hypothetical protein C4334_04710 [Pyrinomonas sp.]|uniref:alanyl-tRNA editing protein n=1 Tax=Pyrinomonas sp. TaxID=2080306 RepID=UPI003318DFD3